LQGAADKAKQDVAVADFAQGAPREADSAPQPSHFFILRLRVEKIENLLKAAARHAQVMDGLVVIAAQNSGLKGDESFQAAQRNLTHSCPFLRESCRVRFSRRRLGRSPWSRIADDAAHLLFCLTHGELPCKKPGTSAHHKPATF
jgi:hypothetical protein